MKEEPGTLLSEQGWPGGWRGDSTREREEEEACNNTIRGVSLVLTWTIPSQVPLQMRTMSFQHEPGGTGACADQCQGREGGCGTLQSEGRASVGRLRASGTVPERTRHGRSQPWLCVGITRIAFKKKKNQNTGGWAADQLVCWGPALGVCVFRSPRAILIAARTQDHPLTRSKSSAVVLKWSSKKEEATFCVLGQNLSSGQGWALQGARGHSFCASSEASETSARAFRKCHPPLWVILEEAGPGDL